MAVPRPAFDCVSPETGGNYRPGLLGVHNNRLKEHVSPWRSGRLRLDRLPAPSMRTCHSGELPVSKQNLQEWVLSVLLHPKITKASEPRPFFILLFLIPISDVIKVILTLCSAYIKSTVTRSQAQLLPTHDVSAVQTTPFAAIAVIEFNNICS